MLSVDLRVQEARQRMSYIKHFAGHLNSQPGADFASQAFMHELNSFM